MTRTSLELTRAELDAVATTASAEFGDEFSDEVGDWLVAEASSLGLAPGRWPPRIVVVGEDDIVIYVRSEELVGGGYAYVSASRGQLRVLND